MKSQPEIVHNYLGAKEEAVSWQRLPEEQKKKQARQIFATLAKALGYEEKEQRID